MFSIRQIEIMEAATRRIDQQGIQELTIKNLSADLKLSEAALYRHFKSKNDILLGLLTYFQDDMKLRIEAIMEVPDQHPSEMLRQIFTSQLRSFEQTPAIVSVIFAESIFQFNRALHEKVTEIMGLMQKHIQTLVFQGQMSGNYTKTLGAESLTTIIMGSMRMVVLKWKLSGNKSNLTVDGLKILNGLLTMFEK